MAWYYGTYSCGHEGRTNIIGPTKDRRWKADRHFSGLCPECWEVEKQRKIEEENKKAAAEAAEMGLPQLEGTEKQITWAETLRVKITKNIINYLETGVFLEIKEEEGKMLWDRILSKNNSARFWIDIRNSHITTIEELLLAEKELMNREQEEILVPENIREEALENMTIRPSTPITSLITEIRFNEEKVYAKLPEKNENFRLLLRTLKFSWSNGQWERKIGLRTGTALDRAAELGVNLLASGFPVRVFDEILQEKIIACEFEQECTRWITKKAKEDVFVIKWDRKEEDFYRESKRLPGAKWESGNGMLVRKESFREVQDFADKYKFKISPGAFNLIEEAEKIFEAAMIADLSVPTKEDLPQPGQRETLKAEDVKDDIHEDLRDDN